MKILWTLICIGYWFASVETAKPQINLTCNVQDVETPNSSELPPDSFIIGGVEAEKNEFPWIVNLRIEVNGAKTELCGGTLIALDTVLTAAHCLVEDDGTVIDPRKVVAVAGDHNLCKNDGTEQNATATCYRIHENYNRESLIHDIALIKLEKNFSSIANGPVRPISLPQNNANITGNSATGTAAGWGWLTGGEGTPETPVSSVLMKVEVPLVTNQNCTDRMTNSAGQFCAGTSGKDSCQGDSGGPFLCSSNRAVICGIISYGPKSGCGQPNKPGVNTKISSYVSWINENIKCPARRGHDSVYCSSNLTAYPFSFAILLFVTTSILSLHF